jgi:hypothetical protein
MKMAFLSKMVQADNVEKMYWRIVVQGSIIAGLLSVADTDGVILNFKQKGRRPFFL